MFELEYKYIFFRIIFFFLKSFLKYLYYLMENKRKSYRVLLKFKKWLIKYFNNR